ncbi:MAG: hypothetical protein ONB48_03890 [candidate division KSB1 bacterium]|nr:hypothetical protein [candidate division KSB1 bacterium]MDZ7274548.1 hypothetical protein [candidate division KSB1 bacterium]MDZ7284791.1 hypothetical protein [candidate division KSB1 bacterium]MDZ7297789.1 hypothetical protein [candidate division KSB1 bacterium]MDZ7306422.1 hypothetical protein [candidate division KSB1 bacterium]
MKTRGITRLLPVIGLLLVPVTLGSCAAPARHPHGARVVVIDAGHVHTVHCGHYRHGNRWFYLKGHVHGPRCGHHLVGGVWIVR